MKKYIYVIIFILIILLPKIYVYIREPTCLGWDCGFYVYNISGLESPAKDLYYYLIYILRPFIVDFGLDAFFLLKTLMVLMNITLLFGVYLILKDKIDFKLLLFILILMAYIPSMVRLGTDLYRNFFIMMLMPYLLYFLEKNNFTVSGLIFGIMFVTHPTTIFYIPIMFFYFLLNNDKKKLKNILIFSFLAFFIIFSFFTTTYMNSRPKHVMMSETPFSYQVNLLKGLSSNASQIDFKSLVNNIYYFFYFNISAIPIAFYALYYFTRKDKIYLFSSISLLIILLFFYASGTEIRLTLLIGFPMVILSAYFLQKQSPLLKKIFCILLCIPIAYGVIYTLISNSPTTNNEAEFFRTLDIPENSIIIIPDRSYFFVKYYTKDRYNVTLGGWFEIEGLNKTNESMLFNSSLEEASQAIINLKDKYNVSTFYMYWNTDLDLHNITTLQELERVEKIRIVKNSKSEFLAIV